LFEQSGNIFLSFFQQVGMASIEEVWGKAFPKKHYNMLSKHNDVEEKRDPEREGRVFPTPIHRTTAALQRHKKTIDDLSKTLPIVGSDEEAEANYGPAKIGPTKEHMTNWSSTKASYTNPYHPLDTGTDFAYAPPSFQEAAYDVKLNKIMRMIEQNRTGYETPSSQDMMLYIFTGVFFLFTLDSFVSLGRRIK
jgi:hypothetical protein